MHFGISTRFFRNQPLTVDVLERFRKAKFERLEIFGNRPHFDFHDRKTLRSIARWFDENETPAPSIHLPFEEPYSRDHATALPLFAAEARLRQRAIDELKRCMELAEFTRVSYAVMHLGADGESFNPVLLEYAYAAIAAVQKFSGVRVLIENTLNESSTFERIREFISVAQLQNVGICYDTGHAYLRNLNPELNQIEVIQLNDTDGTRDAHLWPFEGRLDWPALVEKMTLAQFKGDLLFETEGGTLENSKPVSDRLNGLAYEAGNSIEEFRLKHKLKSRNPETGEMD
jgi:sugar phosphate isomerase/epimerase